MKKQKSNMILTLATILALGFLIGVIYSNEFAEKRTEYKLDGKSITLSIPAVDADGNGVIGTLTTSIKPGNGLVLVNVNNILAQYDTQLSGRIAAIAAGKYTGYDMNTVDVVYNMKVNASIIEGPSAGSSMAVAIVLALENKTLTNNIMLTGTIDQDGNIGHVGSILEKARIAKASGASLLIVPSGQGTEKKLAKAMTCRSANYCSITYIEDNVNIENFVGLQVKEAKNIDEVLKLM